VERALLDCAFPFGNRCVNRRRDLCESGAPFESLSAGYAASAGNQPSGHTSPLGNPGNFHPHHSTDCHHCTHRNSHTQSITTVSLPTPTSDLGVLYPFVLKSNPIPMSNLVFHPDGDCSWQGIAGQVQDMQGRPVRGLSVHLIGSYNGRAVDMTTLSGAAQAWYGESGFEFVLGTTPLDSKDELYLQLADQGMVALSAAVPVETFSACDKNLVLVNFKQVR